jgi:hypothetical protein
MQATQIFKPDHSMPMRVPVTADRDGWAHAKSRQEVETMRERAGQTLEAASGRLQLSFDKPLMTKLPGSKALDADQMVQLGQPLSTPAAMGGRLSQGNLPKNLTGVLDHRAAAEARPAAPAAPAAAPAQPAPASRISNNKRPTTATMPARRPMLTRPGTKAPARPVHQPPVRAGGAPAKNPTRKIGDAELREVAPLHHPALWIGVIGGTFLVAAMAYMYWRFHKSSIAAPSVAGGRRPMRSSAWWNQRMSGKM